MTRTPIRQHTFVCLRCGAVIDGPEGQGGFLKCQAGHRVQIVKANPLWKVALLSFWIAFTVISVAIHLFQTVWLNDQSRVIVWAILTVSVVWSGFLAFRGKQVMNEPAPIGTLGRQYVVSGLSRIFATGILGAMAAMQISY